METTGLFDLLADDDHDHQSQVVAAKEEKIRRCEEIGFDCKSIHHRRCSVGVQLGRIFDSNSLITLEAVAKKS